MKANMTSAAVRDAFLNFFQQKNHTIEPSSSLVPSNDATLLFTNAGMVPFKDVFLGREKRNFVRAASSQRCVRAGGKHNDLENVGYTARHHTFFEMLGNFSFGDYFKVEAIEFAWKFLTVELEIPAEKLWVTVFDEDAEAEQIWLEKIGIDSSRLSKIGAKDNFWSMGDTGPCGPCSEIFYDHGEAIAGGPPGTPEEEGDRYIEIWNLVFMQYNRDLDGTLHPLPKPSVDTGMGLERISAILQGVHNNYEIDLFRPLLKTAATLANTKDLTLSSLRVIADHIRSCAFLIVDDVMPSNEGRGYVLRRIIRRAIRHGYRLDIHDIFFYKLVTPLVSVMGEAYPELKNAQAQIERILKKEEQRFSETLEQGMKILEAHVSKMSGQVISGDVAFLLYDTYGFPLDLTADFARENNLTVDHAQFDVAMNAQRELARGASHFNVNYEYKIDHNSQTEFTGYQSLVQTGKIIDAFVEGNSTELLQVNDEAVLILDKTPFYGESGGQIGDTGIIEVDGGVFEVTDTQKQAGMLFLHHGKVKSGEIQIGHICQARVDANPRKATELNHSTTHLLHTALRDVLGDHVTQKGSLVNAHNLRFDFSHFEPMTRAQIKTIEILVNQQIRLNHHVQAEVMSKELALKAGAMALFGEKYGDEVRVLTMGDFSTELCGGTHVERTGEIGICKIISETGIASGVRRLEAVTGKIALEWIQKNEQTLTDVSQILKSSPDKAEIKIQQLLDNHKLLEKELDRLKTKLASSAGDKLSAQAIEINGIKVLAVELKESNPKAMRIMVDQLKNKLGKAVIILATVKGEKVSLIAGVSKAETKQIKAGSLVNFVAQQVGGKGGGRPDMAQAGGNNPAALTGALKQVSKWVEEQTT